MRKLLLITGDLAAGKSTFAKILARRYKVCAFCKDDIKEVLGETFWFSDREEDLRLSQATVAMMNYLFSEFSGTGGSLILEADFHGQELEILNRKARECSYGVLTLVLRGSAELLHERYINRIMHEGRNPVHLSANLDELEDFRDRIESQREEALFGNVVYIDANDFEYQTDEWMLSGIDAFMEDS